MNIVSFGGGTNSTAMIIGMHQRHIPIDLITFSDTGGERPETYEFIKIFNAWLRLSGLPGITVLQYTTRDGSPLTLEEACLKQHGLSGVAYGKADCSVKFKIQPQEKFCNNNAGCKAVWKRGGKIDKFIGFDAKEQRRYDKNKARYDADKKYAYHFPLLEWGWGRDECVAAIRCAGLPLPGKSSCFFCPNNRKIEIQRLWERHPGLFDRAVAIERNARKTRRDGRPSSITGLGRDWTWEDYRKAYFELAEAKARQLVFPGFEDVTGGCCCGLPCGCNDGWEEAA